MNDFIFYLNEDNFIEQFIEWYDAGKPNYKMFLNKGSDKEFKYGGVGKYILREYEDGYEVAREEDESRRWSRWVDVIFDFGGRYFSIGYDEGLTEMQENDYWDTDNSIVEVWPHKRVIEITEWTCEKN